MSIHNLELVALIRIAILSSNKKPLDLPDHIVSYVDDISIPHTCEAFESHNHKFYIISKMESLNGFDMAYNYDPFVLTLHKGNYTGANLASGTQDLLNGFAVTFDWGFISSCKENYHH